MGRRRVGKTFLIREYYGAHMAFDMTGAYEQSTEYQLDNFLAFISSAQKDNWKPQNQQHGMKPFVIWLNIYKV
ncbi:MAG: hypothetical protein IPL23_28210 [Saprospiraceae bacterium]|nr:hypothetical protein [Saprospiraceae bacterium]